MHHIRYNYFQSPSFNSDEVSFMLNFMRTVGYNVCEFLV